MNDLSFLRGSPAVEHLTHAELRTVKYHVLGNRNIYIPASHLIYLASASVNSICESVSILAHVSLSNSRAIQTEPREHFFSSVLSACLAYFGSKVLNHKRKCDLEDDFKLLLEHPAGRGALPRERMLRKVAKLVLRHCAAQRQYLRDGKYRAPLAVSGPQQMPVFLELTRNLGSILGEKLYASYIEGRYPAKEVEALFSKNFDSPREAKKTYLDLVSKLEASPLSHTSKSDLF